MKKIVYQSLILIAISFFLMPVSSFASEESSPLDKSLYGLNFGVLAYLDYSIGTAPMSGGEEEDFSAFNNTRGYFTVKKKILPWMGMRVTFDIHQDDHGDYKVRHKYLYAELKANGGGFFTDLKSEIGMGHMPWLDFEEHINPYRCQGTMAIERAGTFNSADLGISLRGYLGGHLENVEERTGTHYYTGKWGSWHLGVYNGGGYHAPENNENKLIEGRLTIRPLPSIVPGLQFSLLGISGKGNVEEGEDEQGNDIEAPDFNVMLGMLSFEHPRIVLTAQYYNTEGNAKGDWIDDHGEALKTSGYSIFGKVKLPLFDDKLSLWGRYDYFDSDIDDVVADNTCFDMMIAGIVYDFYKSNLLMLVFETTEYGEDNGGKKKGPSEQKELGDDSKIQAVWQIKF